jgi:hypothetical protein
MVGMRVAFLPLNSVSSEGNDDCEEWEEEWEEWEEDV